MYEWINGNTYLVQATFSPSNITLNNAAKSHFENCRYVRIGLDREKKKVAIMPVEKKDIERCRIPIEQLQKISIGKSYARISNKMLMHEIYTSMHVHVDSCKYAAAFNEKENILEIFCDKEIG